MKISIISKEPEFIKQAKQLFQDIEGDNVSLSDKLENDTNVIVSDGKTMSVYSEELPVFTISHNIPENISKEQQRRFYKVGEFDVNKLISDMRNWVDIWEDVLSLINEADMWKEEATSLKRQVSAYESRLKYANTLQRESFLTEKISHISCAKYFLPYEEVSGDFCVIKKNYHKLFVVIGDVVDHGISSGLYAAYLTSAVESYMTLCSKFNANIQDLVRFVKESGLVFNTEDSSYKATALFCEIDLRKNTAYFISAGHENPVIISKSGVKELNIGARLSPIGDPAIIIPQPTQVPFYCKDGILVYTDGITESFKSTKDMNDLANSYSTERLVSSVQAGYTDESWVPETIVESVVKDVESYTIEKYNTNSLKKSGVVDDSTLVVVKWEEEE